MASDWTHHRSYVASTSDPTHASASDRIQVSTSEITTIKIYSDQEDGIYYVDEDVTLKADIGNPSAVRVLAWHRKTMESLYSKQQRASVKHENPTVERGKIRESHAIDTTSTKYLGSILKPECPLLKIRRCDMTDAGTYILLVSCIDLDIYSNEIHLTVKADRPVVALNEIPSACPYDCVKIIATVRSYPKHTNVIWKKGKETIDIKQPKYDGSSVVGNHPVLCINNTREDDGDVYSILVENELGIGISSEELFVIGVRQMIFISGPVVVSPSETINFEAIVPVESYTIPKWWKITKHSRTEIQPDNTKYFVYQKEQIHSFEILNAEKGDSATYQFSWDNIKSNKIHTIVDDSGKYSTYKQENCLRLYALQAVSADALRKVFHNPKDFEDKKKGLKNYCRENLSKGRNKELLSRLEKEKKTSLNDIDITLMYAILRNSVSKPKKGWGKPPKKNDIELADDIERIHQCRNLICHTDASEIETTLFNESVLDLLEAIRRLSKNNVELMEEVCGILNKVFTRGKDVEQMMEKLEIFKKEQHYFDQLLTLPGEHSSTTLITERSNQNADVKFHDVCDSDITIMGDRTTATQGQLYSNNICFMNRPLTLKDEVHVHGKPNFTNLLRHKDNIYVKIGLTSIDPDEIRSSESKLEACGCTLRRVDIFEEESTEISSKEFNLCFSLCGNDTLSIKLNGTKQTYLRYREVSNVPQVWLAIQPYGIKSIKISNIIK